MSAPTPQDARHELLEPYLQRLRAFLRAHGDENRPLTVSFGQRALLLSPWERRAVWRSLCEGKDTASDWHR